MYILFSSNQTYMNIQVDFRRIEERIGKKYYFLFSLWVIGLIFISNFANLLPWDFKFPAERLNIYFTFFKLYLYDHLSRFKKDRGVYRQNNVIFRFVQRSFCLFIYKFTENILPSCSKMFIFIVSVFYYITCT